MINSVKKYMFVDLLLLASIGFIVDLFGIKFECLMLGGIPTSLISFLVLFIALARWNLWGLIITPILSLAILIGGKNSGSEYLSYAYDYRLYLANLTGLLFFGLNVFFYRKGKTKEVINSSVKLSLLIIFDYLVYSFIMVITYRILTSGNIFESGVNNISYINRENQIVIVNVCNYVENVFINNLLGLAVLFIGVFILRSQGIVCNKTQQFIDDKENAELMSKDLEFRIEDADEKVLAENLSQTDAEEKH